MDPAPQPRRKIRLVSCVTWAAVIFLTALLVAIIAVAVTVLVLALLLQPHGPYMAVEAATLNAFRCNAFRADLREVEVALAVEAKNDNSHSAATFSQLEIHLRFAGKTLATLRADGPLHAPARTAVPLRYLATARDAPLDGFGLATVQTALRDGVVAFEVDGEARTRYNFTRFVTINTRTHIKCQVRFFLSNGSTLPFICTGKKHGLF